MVLTLETLLLSLNDVICAKMNAAEMSSLMWEHHTNTLKDALHTLVETSEFADVTLVCDDQEQIQAHKFILSAYSTVFRNMLKGSLKSNVMIYLKGVKFSELKSILQYLYTGETLHPQESIENFFRVSTELDILGLSSLTMPQRNNSHEEIFESKNQIEEVAVQDENIEPIGTNFAKKGDVTTNRNENMESNFYVDKGQQTDSDQLVQVSKTNEIEMFRCTKCEKKFSNKEDLKLHFFSSHALTCYHCNYEATAKSSLKNHIDSIHENVRYTCQYCDKKLSRKTLLRYHIEKFHKMQALHDSIIYQCSFECDFKTTQRSKLKTHVKRCNYKAIDEIDIKSHKDAAHKKDDLTTESWFL